jgi:hypothetical protein
MAALFPKRKKPGFCLGKPRRSTNARPLLFIRTKETALEYTRAVSRDSALGGAQKLGTRLPGSAVPSQTRIRGCDAGTREAERQKAAIGTRQTWHKSRDLNITGRSGRAW